MALRLQELNPDVTYSYVCTPTGNELPDMIQHWVHLSELLGTPLKVLSSGVSLGGLIRQWNALPNWRQRWCTRVLKIEPFQNYLAGHLPAAIYVGIRADEAEAREGVEFAGDIERHFPLVEWGWGLKDVLNYLDDRGVSVPKRTDCAACFFQTLGEWYSLWKNHPDEYEQACRWEDQTGHTFRSPQRDTWPTSLRLLAIAFENGNTPKPSSMKDRTVMCSTCAH